MGGAGSARGGLPGAARAEKAPEQVRGSSTLKDQQDKDQELGSGKSFQQKKRTSDSYSVLISVVGFFKAQNARTCGCPFSPINSCQFFMYNSRWIYIEEWKQVVHQGSIGASRPQF